MIAASRITHSMGPDAEGLSLGSMSSASQTVGWLGSVQATR